MSACQHQYSEDEPNASCLKCSEHCFHEDGFEVDYDRDHALICNSCGCDVECHHTSYWDNQCELCGKPCPHEELDKVNTCFACGVNVPRPLFDKPIEDVETDALIDYVDSIMHTEQTQPLPELVEVAPSEPLPEPPKPKRKSTDGEFFGLVLTRDEWIIEGLDAQLEKQPEINTGGSTYRYHTSVVGRCKRDELQKRRIAAGGQFWVERWEKELMITPEFEKAFKQWAVQPCNQVPDESLAEFHKFTDGSGNRRFLLFARKYFYKQVYRWTLVQEQRFPRDLYARDEQVRNIVTDLIRRSVLTGVTCEQVTGLPKLTHAKPADTVIVLDEPEKRKREAEPEIKRKRRHEPEPEPLSSEHSQQFSHLGRTITVTVKIDNDVQLSPLQWAGALNFCPDGATTYRVKFE